VVVAASDRDGFSHRGYFYGLGQKSAQIIKAAFALGYHKASLNSSGAFYF